MVNDVALSDKLRELSALLEAGDFAAAVTTAKDGLQTSNDAGIWRGYIFSLLQEGCFEEVQQAILKLPGKDTALSKSLQFELAYSHYKLNEFAQGLSVANAARRALTSSQASPQLSSKSFQYTPTTVNWSSEDDKRLALLEAQLLYRLGLYFEASRIYSEFIVNESYEAEEDETMLKVNLAACEASEDGLFSQHRAADRGRSRLVGLGLVNHHRGVFGDANNDYDDEDGIDSVEAFCRGSESTELTFNVACRMIELGRLETALRLIKASEELGEHGGGGIATELSSDATQLIVQRAYILHRLGQSDEAYSLLKKAVTAARSLEPAVGIILQNNVAAMSCVAAVANASAQGHPDSVEHNESTSKAPPSTSKEASSNSFAFPILVKPPSWTLNAHLKGIATPLESEDAAGSKPAVTTLELRSLKSQWPQSSALKLTRRQVFPVLANRFLTLLQSGRIPDCERILASLRSPPAPLPVDVAELEATMALAAEPPNVARAYSALTRVAKRLPPSMTPCAAAALVRVQSAAASLALRLGLPNKAACNLSGLNATVLEDAKVDGDLLRCIVSVMVMGGEGNTAHGLLRELALRVSSKTSARADILLLLADSCNSIGEFEAAANSFREALEIYEEYGMEEKIRRCIIGAFTSMHNAGDAVGCQKYKEMLLEKGAFSSPELRLIDPDDVEGMAAPLPLRGNAAIRSATVLAKHTIKVFSSCGLPQLCSTELMESWKTLRTKESSRGKKKRKPRFPRGFDPSNPGPPPDPERWLPKHERSTYKKPKAKGKIFRGAQGSIAGGEVKRGPTTANVEVSSSSKGNKPPATRSGRRRK